MTDVAERIRELYLHELRHGPDRVKKKKLIWDAIRGQLLAEVADGRLPLDIEAALLSEFNTVDNQLGDAAERMLVTDQTGQTHIPLDLDAVVKLGNGDRILYGDMLLEEFMRWEDLKSGNVHAVVDAYQRFRRDHEPIRPLLITEGLTVAQAWERVLHGRAS